MKRITEFLVLLVLLGACSHSFEFIPDHQIARGIFSPVQLGLDTTVVFISDYIPDYSLVDSISMDGIEKDQLQKEGNKIKIFADKDMPGMSVLKLWVGDTPYALLVKKSEKIKKTLIYDPGSKVHTSVRARGEFNRWNARNTVFSFVDGKWIAEIVVNPGTYQYLLVIDGEERLDPGNPDSVNNNAGGFNSLIRVGDNGTDKPRLFTSNVDSELYRDEIIIGTENPVNQYFVFWENFQLQPNMLEIKDDGDFEIKIPGPAGRFKRTYVRVWAVNDNGFSNEVLVPLEHGKVLQDASLMGRNEPYRMILYNAFIDRFYNGDPGNDRPVEDPVVLPPANYHGGDLQGIIQKIKEGYFNNLGINTIWVSPVILNPDGAYGYWPDPPSRFSGYHGYWPISFTRIDPRFGTAEQLQELVRLAHDKKLNVLLDIVANHVHKEHPMYKKHPEWATDLYLPDGTENTQKWDEYRLTTWFDTFLPTLDLEKPVVYNMLSDSAVWWIKQYGLDGFRHDATKHIPEVFWRTLTYKLKTQVTLPEQRDIFQIGETYGSPELISSYLGSGLLDGQFDFNVYDEALASIIRPEESFKRLDAALQQSLRYYGVHNLMGYITGNQDRGRFASYAGGDLLFDEDAKLAGWTRDIGVGNPVAYDKLAMLFAFNMSIPGIPVIYYGDEIGMPGGNDPDSRRMMRFGGLSEKEKELKEKVATLAKLRTDHLALIYGDLEVLMLSDEVYVIARTYFDEIVISAFNKSSESVSISISLPERFAGSTLKSVFGGDLVQGEGNLEISIEGNGVELLIN